MRTLFNLITIIIAAGFTFTGCKMESSNNKTKNMKIMDKGTYGYDKQFLDEYHETVELQNGQSALLLVPGFQGRVMTSTCEGDSGFSFGWINYDLIENEKVVDHFNPFGGEERFWLGPEGGQFSVYFEKDTEFEFDNWFVPPAIDTEPFHLVSSDSQSAIFDRKMNLVNYSGTEFNLYIKRKVSLLSSVQIANHIKAAKSDLKVVAYESENTIVNTGEEAWEKETGLLSIWMLGMFTPSPEVTVVIPVNEGDAETMGPKVIDDYFGKISADRLIIKNNTIFFKADGKSRGKLGIPPARAQRFMGSYDAKNGILTVLECELPQGEMDYVNSAWEIQEDPYKGDALNSYNDGPLEDGSQMGPFYELEASSPALSLDSGQEYTHIQRTYHFRGKKEQLDDIARSLFSVSLSEIEAVF